MKYILLVVLFISSITGWATGIDTIDYATLINLRESDQRKFIDSVQQISVELDGMFEKDEITEKKYVHLKTILNNLLLSSAYAQDDVINQKALIKGVENNNNINLCIFGGWVSLMGRPQKNGNFTSDDKTRCMSPNYIKYYLKKNSKHIYERLGYSDRNQAPSEVKDLLAEIARNHPDQDGVNSKCKPIFEKSKEPSTTVCNPTLFGVYPDGKKDKNLICVSAKNKGDAHNNISLACKIKADKIKENSAQSKKYYEDLQNSLGEGNISEFVNLFTNSCFCDAKDARIHGVSLDTKYIARMQQGRTCYAWMYQMKDVLNNSTASTCRALKGKVNGKQSQLELTQNLFNIINKIEDEPKFSTNGGYDETDKQWTEILSKTKNFNKCPIEFENKPTPKPNEVASCEVAINESTVTLSLKDGKDLKVTYQFQSDDGNLTKTSDEDTKLGDDGKIEIDLGSDFNKYTSAKATINKNIPCKIDLPKPKVKECSANYKELIAHVKYDGPDGLIVNIKLEEADEVVASDKLKDKMSLVSLIESNYESSQLENGLVQILENDKVISSCNLTAEEGEEEQEQSVDENIEYSISLELGDREGKHQEVRAVVKKGDEIVKLEEENLKINWYVTEKKKKKKKKKNKDNDDELVKREEKEADEIKGMDLFKANSNVSEMKFLNSLDKREVLAVLIKESKEEGKDQIDIPPNTPRKPAAKISPRLKKPNLKQRYRSSEGMGIHRGIR